MAKNDFPFEPAFLFEKFLGINGFLEALKPYESSDKMDALEVLKDSMRTYAAFWILKHQKDTKTGKEVRLLTSDF